MAITTNVNGLGTTSASGLVSGLDTNSIISSLVTIAKSAETPLKTSQTQEQTRLSAYQTLNSLLLTLQKAAETLATPNTYAARTASSSDTGYLMVTADSGADVGSYEVEIQQLAQAHKVRGGTLASSSAALGLSGDVRINGHAIHVAADDTLADVRTAINDAGCGVTASIQCISATDYRLVLTATTQGADSAIDFVDANSSDLLESLGLVTSATSTKHAITNGMASDALADATSTVKTALGLSAGPSGTVTINGQAVAIDLATQSLTDIKDAIDALAGVTATIQTETVDGETQYTLKIVGDSGTPTVTDDSNVLNTLGVLEKGVAHQIAAAQDAQFTLDGQTITRDTNQISDVLEGVTFNLRQETGASPVTFTVAENAQDAVNAIQSFVSAYNNIAASLNTSLNFDEEAGTSGVFFGESAILYLQSSLHSSLMGTVESLGQAFTCLGNVGLSTDGSGNLVFNQTEFLAALDASGGSVTNLFCLGTRVSDSTNVSFVSAGTRTADSGPSGYAVHVTTAAEQAMGLGTQDLSGGMLVDETLTINNVAVNLTTGMTLDQVVDTINGTLQTAGSTAVTASHDGQHVKLTSAGYGAASTITVTSSVDITTAGSTGLGGGTAGTKATFKGVDVAGTINGEACTGSGRALRGNSGNAMTDGLALQIMATTPGDYGTVVVSKGAAERLSDYLTQVTGTDGLIQTAEDAVQSRIDGFAEQIQSIEDSASRYEERLQTQFAALETKLAQLQSISDYLNSQTEALKYWTTYNGN